MKSISASSENDKMKNQLPYFDMFVEGLSQIPYPTLVVLPYPTPPHPILHQKSNLILRVSHLTLDERPLGMRLPTIQKVILRLLETVFITGISLVEY